MSGIFFEIWKVASKKKIFFSSVILVTSWGREIAIQSIWYCWWFRNPANQLRLVVYPIIYEVLIYCIWGGCLGFLPSTVGSITPLLKLQENLTKIQPMHGCLPSYILSHKIPWSWYISLHLPNKIKTNSWIGWSVNVPNHGSIWILCVMIHFQDARRLISVQEVPQSLWPTKL